MIKFNSKFLILNIIFIILIFFSLFTKLFTYYSFCKEEPTAMIVLRYQPIWDNLPGSDCPSHCDQNAKILFYDENELIFQDIYFFIIHCGWWLGIVFWIIFLLYHLRFLLFKNKNIKEFL